MAADTSRGERNKLLRDGEYPRLTVVEHNRLEIGGRQKVTLRGAGGSSVEVIFTGEERALED